MDSGGSRCVRMFWGTCREGVEGERMSSFDDRMDLAVDWFGRSQLSDGSGGAGWGWVADVPPNPQNTAEVVCALKAADREVPRAAEVLRLLRRSVVGRQGGSAWAFEAPVDIAWRLRALRWLGVRDDDHDVVTCIEALLAAQDAESGGWRMSGRAGPTSITATAAALHALGELAVAEERVAQVVLRGVSFLAMSMVSEDVRAQPMYAAAHIAAVLARPEFVSVGGRRSRRATELAVRRLLDGLAREEDKVEEEPFRRGEVSDTWRHLSLHLSVGAVVAADSASIFTPAMRKSLAELLDLQEMTPRHAHRGGFRTSAEGFVTSYATTQALEAMAQARLAVHESINPGRVFDIICSIEGPTTAMGRSCSGGDVRRW